ncbi:TniQ family protein [Paenibacillus radicis (ex Xue et al. 2023)]|uniref:TniQ family protein n=1 Tax=Paenibacillus radicis (ex Xue et al. 2023) TaxID=2972489 RepID=A0ABT1YDC3_9BACL|nr:TniQ family protein [Paenibacillus radicis (ex Xue et al. 2023)]MCR8631181.1 TniQ family protein [Paenibacillus radicis (ex Xue et al. 2023)]
MKAIELIDPRVSSCIENVFGVQKENHLLVVLKPYSDESIFGYLLRTFKKNNYKFSLYKELTGFKKMKKFFFPDELYKLSTLLLKEQNLLECHNFFLSATERSVDAVHDVNQIHSYFVMMEKIKICCSCINSKNYYKKVWDVIGFTCCPEHQTLLIDKCSICNISLTISVLKNDYICKCGFDLRNSVQKSISLDELLISHIVLELSQNRIPIFLKKLEVNIGYSIDYFLNDIYLIANQIWFIQENTKLIPKILSNERMHLLLMEVNRVLENWPCNFNHFLDKVKQFNHKRLVEEKGIALETAGGLRVDFGEFYSELFRNKRSNSFLRKQFEHYIKSNLQNYLMSFQRKRRDSFYLLEEYLPLHEAAKLLNVTRGTVRALLKHKILSGIEYEKNNLYSAAYIERCRLIEVIEQIQHCSSLNEMMDKFGLNRPVLLHLLKYLDLKSYLNTKEHRYLHVLYKNEDINMAIKKFRNVCIEIGKQNNLIFFKDVLKKISMYSLTTEQIFNLIETRKLPVYLKKGDLFAFIRVLFNEDEVIVDLE